MTEWFIVISLLLFGLILVIVEVIFIPGTTFVGVAGFVSMLVGVSLTFKYFGAETGWTTLGGATAASGILLYISFRTDVWKKFALKSSIDSKVNEVEPTKFAIGMEGIATSALRPFGNGEFAGNTAEVRTSGEYVESGNRIRIIRLMSNQIIVENIN